MTICPGRQVSHAFGGEWDRNLDADLTVIRDWGARALVSLMEEHEMAYYGIADLPDRTRALGLAHYHLPIVDMDVPDHLFENLWYEYGETLRDMLLAGESIVIHCLGGLGRTGTVAGRLLVELGADPEYAIRQIRSSRPGTIQTIQQEHYVRSCKRS